MKYFIHYETSNAKGNCVIKRDSPICELEDIQGLETLIRREQSYDNPVIILGWQKMEMPE